MKKLFKLSARRKIHPATKATKAHAPSGPSNTTEQACKKRLRMRKNLLPPLAKKATGPRSRYGKGKHDHNHSNDNAKSNKLVSANSGKIGSKSRKKNRKIIFRRRKRNNNVINKKTKNTVLLPGMKVKIRGMALDGRNIAKKADLIVVQNEKERYMKRVEKSPYTLFDCREKKMWFREKKGERIILICIPPKIFRMETIPIEEEIVVRGIVLTSNDKKTIAVLVRKIESKSDDEKNIDFLERKEFTLDLDQIRKKIEKSTIRDSIDRYSEKKAWIEEDATDEEMVDKLPKRCVLFRRKSRNSNKRFSKAYDVQKKIRINRERREREILESPNSSIENIFQGR